MGLTDIFNSDKIKEENEKLNRLIDEQGIFIFKNLINGKEH